MRLLFEMDTKDYNLKGKIFIRHSARAIIIKKNKVAMVYSQKYNYYKFPGGGIRENELKVEALIREAKEESGLVIIPSSIREFGYVHRITKSEYKEIDCFLQDNYYYLCDVEEKIGEQMLDEYEKEEGYILKWVHPSVAIKTNMKTNKGMLIREAKVLEILLMEKYII